MSFDRAYFVNTREGFTSRFELVSENDDSCIFKRNYKVGEAGEYYLQYYTENYSEITLLSPEQRYTPILHGEDKEMLVFLDAGDNELVFSVHKSQGKCPAFYTRLINEEGRIIRDDLYNEDRDYPVYPEYETDSIPDDYTPAVGKAFRSFGRFGFAKGDGVLDFSMPAFGIISRPYISGIPRYKKHAMWSFSLLPDGESESGRNMKVYKTPENEKIEVDYTHTRWRRELPSGKFISYDYSTVSSSLLIETDLDYISLSRMKAIGSPASATFSVIRDGKQTFVTTTPEDGILYSKARDGELKKNFVILTRQGAFPEVPILITLPESPRTITRDSKGVRLEFDGAVGFALLTFLYGIEVFGTEDLTDEWYGRAIEKALTVHSLSLARPINCREYFKISGESIKIRSEFDYKVFTDSLNTPVLRAAPLPPPVMLEALFEGSAKQDEKAVSLDLPTKYGPLYAVLNKNVSEYELPIPEYRERFVFGEKCKEQFTEMMHSDIDEFISFHKDKGYIPNPGNYSFLFQYAYPSKLFPYLKAEDRERLEGIMQEGLDVVTNPEYRYIGPNGRRCLSWYRRTEPFTGISYLTTYLHITGISKYDHCDREIIENSENVFIELDWGNAMSLYSTWLSALFTGSFDKLSEHFSIFREAFNYYLHNMDFACMASGYAENGVSWNDGTNYGGYLGFINIAEVLGKEEDFKLGLYAFAKLCCLRRGMLLSTQNYFCKYFGVEPWYAAKFFHEETDGDCAFISYPADLVKDGYRRGALYNFTTEGHYREAFEMYAAYLPEVTEKLLSAAERSVIGSITGKKIDEETTYSTLKNGFLGEQETFTYLSLSTILERFSDEELEKMINDAAENGRISREILGNYVWSHRRLSKEWSRITLLSQLYSKGQVALSAWKGLRIESATYPSLALKDVKEGAWLEVCSDTAPNATLNGESVEFIRLRDKIYRTGIKQSGVLKFI